MDRTPVNEHPKQILSFTEFLKLKHRHNTKQPHTYLTASQTNTSTDPPISSRTIPTEKNQLTTDEYIASLEESLNASLSKTKRAQSDLINLEQDYQQHCKVFNDLKATYALREDKLKNDFQLSELSNEEKTKEINELIAALKQQIEIKEKLQLNCDNYQKLNEKIKEINALLLSKSAMNAPNQPEDVNKLFEENDKLRQLVKLKDKVLEKMTSELKEKEKIFNEITKMKEGVDQYANQLNEMGKEIEVRDEMIEKLKRALQEKGALPMKKEDDSKEKQAYANESLIRENNELKKMNQMYKAKYDLIPQLEKRFEELFEENNRLKEENKKLILQYGSCQQVHPSQGEYDYQEEGNDHTGEEEKALPSLNTQQTNQTEQSIGDSFTLYAIYKSSLLAFFINKKEYISIIPNKMDDFLLHYQSKGSITYNTFEGLFILTGALFNQLFYYSQRQNTISSIMSFKESHQYGTMLLDNVSKNLIVLSGSKSNSVECLSFERTELSLLPPLNQPRAKASCCFVNSTLFVFYGLHDQLKEPITTIEFLQMKSLGKGSKWQEMQLQALEEGTTSAFVAHSALNFNDKQIVILGGFNQKNKPNETVFFIDLNDKVIGELNNQLGDQFGKGECCFTTHSMFRAFLKEDLACFINMDDNFNVHMMDSNLKYNFIPFTHSF